MSQQFFGKALKMYINNHQVVKRRKKSGNQFYKKSGSPKGMNRLGQKFVSNC